MFRFHFLKSVLRNWHCTNKIFCNKMIAELKEGAEMIFYFTGTGNSLYAAKELDENIISIPQIIKEEKLEFSADSIGIVCPVYGPEMPGIM